MNLGSVPLAPLLLTSPEYLGVFLDSVFFSDSFSVLSRRAKMKSKSLLFPVLLSSEFLGGNVGKTKVVNVILGT